RLPRITETGGGYVPPGEHRRDAGRGPSPGRPHRARRQPEHPGHRAHHQRHRAGRLRRVRRRLLQRGHIRAIARAVGEDPGPLIEEFDSTWRSAKETTAAEAFQPSMPLRTRERRRVRWTAVLAVLVLGVLGFAGYKFASGVGKTRSAAAGARPSATGAGSPGKASPATANAVQSSAVASSPPSASASSSASASPTATPVTAQD